MSCCCSPLGPGGDAGGGVPLPDALYVAQLSPAGGDGSIAKPFNTIGDGLLALANLGVNFGALLISPGDYSAESVLFWTGGALMLKGYSAGVPFPDPFAGPNPQVQLPSITAQVGFPDLYLDNVTLALGQQFNNFTNIFGVGSELSGVITGGGLSLRASRMVGSMNIGGDLRLWNCEVQTDTNWNIGGSSVELVGTKILSFSAPIVFGGGPGVVTLDSFSNSYFVALGPIPITNGTRTVRAASGPQAFFATLSADGPAPGTSEFSDTLTLTGSDYATGSLFMLTAVVQCLAHTLGFFSLFVQLQASYDGGGVWVPLGSPRSFSLTNQTDPTWMQCSCLAVVPSLTNTQDILVRFEIHSDSGSVDVVDGCNGQLSAIACG